MVGTSSRADFVMLSIRLGAVASSQLLIEGMTANKIATNDALISISLAKMRVGTIKLNATLRKPSC